MHGQLNIWTFKTMMWGKQFDDYVWPVSGTETLMNIWNLNESRERKSNDKMSVLYMSIWMTAFSNLIRENLIRNIYLVKGSVPTPCSSISDMGLVDAFLFSPFSISIRTSGKYVLVIKPQRSTSHLTWIWGSSFHGWKYRKDWTSQQ